MRSSILFLLVILILIGATNGCSSSFVNGAIKAANGLAQGAADAEAVVVSACLAAEKEAIDSASTPADADAAVKVVRNKCHVVFDMYDTLRTDYNMLIEAVDVAKATEAAPDEQKVAEILAIVVNDERVFIEQVNHLVRELGQ